MWDSSPGGASYASHDATAATDASAPDACGASCAATRDVSTSTEAPAVMTSGRRNTSPFMGCEEVTTPGGLPLPPRVTSTPAWGTALFVPDGVDRRESRGAHCGVHAEREPDD